MADYRSYVFRLASGAIGNPQTLFKSSKPDNKPSLFTIVMQYSNYQYGAGGNGLAGAQPTIIGNVAGAQPIINAQLIGQKIVPIVGGIYQAYGTEIQIGFDFYSLVGDETFDVSVHAIEDAKVYQNCDSAIEDAGSSTLVPNFMTGFLTDFAGDYRQIDNQGNTIKTYSAVPAFTYIPLHQSCHSIRCTSSVPGDVVVYQFKRGYL
jgi:hypothetical protein